MMADCQQEYIKVSGKVLNAETKRPIAGANVTVRDTNNRTFTDKNGKFVLSAKKGDIIAIIGKGAEKYNIDKDGYHDFDEKAIINSALKKRKAIF